jgi:hypothetical protein
MKRILILLMLNIVAIGININGAAAQTPAAAKNGPVITFETMKHDFGTFKEGEIHQFIFKFTNTGNAPLVVTEVEQPCGCTIPSWSKEPVMPGAKGEIRVIYNSKDRPGAFRKTLQVKSNMDTGKTPLMLLIKGVADKNAPKSANAIQYNK